MATTCEACGHRSNEVKGGGGIEPQGLKIEVSVVDKEDLCRDILKVSNINRIKNEAPLLSWRT